MPLNAWLTMHLFSHQPLVPVLPVARELISKTKWIASRGTVHVDPHTPSKTPKLPSTKDGTEGSSDIPRKRSQSTPGHRPLPQKGSKLPTSLITSDEMTSEPECIAPDDIPDNHSDDEWEARAPKSRSRILKIFHHNLSRTPTKVFIAMYFITRRF